MATEDIFKIDKTSTSAVERSLFLNERDVDFFNDINAELLELVVKQKINYYAIDSRTTPSHRLYGESTQKKYLPPVELYCRVDYNEPEIVTGRFSTDQIITINVFMPERRVVELGIIPRIGDFLEFDKKYFEVTKMIQSQLIYGLPQYKIGFELHCVLTREQVFQPRVDGTYKESYTVR